MAPLGLLPRIVAPGQVKVFTYRRMLGARNSPALPDCGDAPRQNSRGRQPFSVRWCSSLYPRGKPRGGVAQQGPGARRDFAIGAVIFLFASACPYWWSEGRAGPRFGIPIRYIVLALPLSVASYLTGPHRHHRPGTLVTRCLGLTVLLLLPLNHTAHYRRGGPVGVPRQAFIKVRLEDSLARNQ